jgi:hypothetical protein
MTIAFRHPPPRTGTMCAAFLAFAAIAAIPRVAAAQFTVCHHPPGNFTNAHTITVGSAQAVTAHLTQHLDSLGDCLCTPAESPCSNALAPCCPGSQCQIENGQMVCVPATSSNPMPPGGSCTDSTQCDALNPCNSVGTGNDLVCGG